MPSRIVAVSPGHDARRLVRRRCRCRGPLWIRFDDAVASDTASRSSGVELAHRDARAQVLDRRLHRRLGRAVERVEAGRRLADDDRVAGVAPVAVRARREVAQDRVAVLDHAVGGQAADRRGLVDARREVAGDRRRACPPRPPSPAGPRPTARARVRPGRAPRSAAAWPRSVRCAHQRSRSISSRGLGHARRVELGVDRRRARRRARRAARRAIHGKVAAWTATVPPTPSAASASSTAPRKRDSTSVRSCRSMPVVDRHVVRGRGSRGGLVEVVDDDAERPVAADDRESAARRRTATVPVSMTVSTCAA